MYIEPNTEIAALQTAELMQMAGISDKGGYGGLPAPAREPDLDLF